MLLLINPFGRIVEIPTEKQYNELLNTFGFRLLTDAEKKSYAAEREVKFIPGAKQDESKRGVYLATVSQGGKDGYGVASELIARELQNVGIPVTRYYDGQKVAILFHNPYSILSIQGQYKIIYTMFESDKIPADWHDYLGSADLVLVPSKWCQSVFKKSGIESQVVPLGYNDNVYFYKERINKREQRQNFTFLHYNAFNIRKGFPEVFKAFVKAFRQDEPVKMIFKTNLLQLPLPITKEKYPNIEIITGAMGDRELADLMGRSDCFVLPSRGEGFGVPPLETMATGMPAIIPNAHGFTEYFNSDYMYEVNVKETCPALYSRYKGQDTGNMVVCDIDHLAERMRFVYEHQDEALAKGKKASEYVKQWTIKNTALQLKKIIERAENEIIKDKPVSDLLNLEIVK